MSQDTHLPRVSRILLELLIEHSLGPESTRIGPVDSRIALYETYQVSENSSSSDLVFPTT